MHCLNLQFLKIFFSKSVMISFLKVLPLKMKCFCSLETLFLPTPPILPLFMKTLNELLFTSSVQILLKHLHCCFFSPLPPQDDSVVSATATWFQVFGTSSPAIRWQLSYGNQAVPGTVARKPGLVSIEIGLQVAWYANVLIYAVTGSSRREASC